MTETDPEVSMLPPSQRDRVNLESAVRQQAAQLVELQPGMLGGRFPPAAPTQVSTQEADDEPTSSGEEGDDAQAAWQWEDSYTAGSTGTQYVTLTYVPIEESLFVVWYPDGLGGIPITNEWFSVSGNQVTITPPAGVVAAGDEFLFQYEFEPGSVLGNPDPDPPPTRYSLDICPDVLTVTTNNSFVPSAIVGGDTALCDGSDATYVRIAMSRRVSIPNDRLNAEIPATVLGSTLDTIHVSIRAQYTVNGSTVRRFGVLGLNGPDEFADYIGDFEINNGGTGDTSPCTMPDGTLQNATSAGYFDYDFYPTVPYAATLAAIEAGTFQLYFRIYSPFGVTVNPSDWILDLFEVTLHVEGDL